MKAFVKYTRVCLDTICISVHIAATLTAVINTWLAWRLIGILNILHMGVLFKTTLSLRRWDFTLLNYFSVSIATSYVRINALVECSFLARTNVEPLLWRYLCRLECNSHLPGVIKYPGNVSSNSSMCCETQSIYGINTTSYSWTIMWWLLWRVA